MDEIDENNIINKLKNENIKLLNEIKNKNELISKMKIENSNLKDELNNTNINNENISYKNEYIKLKEKYEKLNKQFSDFIKDSSDIINESNGDESNKKIKHLKKIINIQHSMITTSYIEMQDQKIFLKFLNKYLN